MLCAAVVLAAGAALTACGGGNAGGGSNGSGDEGGGHAASDSGVASLKSPSADGTDGATASGPSGGASAQSSQAAVDAKRPQLRLDTSPEERARLGDAYNACLQAHGVPMNTERAAAAGAKQASPMQGPNITKDYQAAFQACLVKLPLQPVEQRPETNPHYADDYRDYVACLNAKGFTIHEVFKADGSPDGWTYNSGAGNGLSDAQQNAFDHTCTLEAFGGKK